MQYISLLVWPFFISFFISFLLAPLGIFVAKKLKAVDDPKTNKHPKVIHNKPTARGSLSIFAGLILTSLLLLPFDSHLKGILTGALILMVLGVLDDKYNLNPYFRLLIMAVAALMPIISGIGISFINNPIGGGIIDLSNPRIIFTALGSTHSIWIISDLFALLWITALMNFMNMGAKGLPGQLPGVTGIAALTIALLSLKFSADITEWSVTILACITAGTFLGYLYWNMFPQRIMPGFGGSTLAGYLLATLSILTTAKVGTLALVLAVPLIDTTYTIIRRIKEGKSPVWGDRGHLHHKLLDLGLSQKRVTYFYWAVSALLGALAIQLGGLSKIYTILAIGLFLLIFILWFTTQLNKQKH